MASRQDGKKQREWEVRLERCRASGLTVAEFCKRERFSLNTYYYWARRVRSASATTPSPRSGNAARRSPRTEKHAPTADGMPNAALVRFYCRGEVEVSVPADCLDAIRCLATWLSQARAEHSDAFQEVIVTR